VFRWYDLRGDPPAYFADGSQDVTTDGAYLTLHARSAVLFGEADPFGYETWPAFKYSLVSAVAWLMFTLVGATRQATSMVGILLNISAIAIFLLALSRRLSLRATLITAIFICSDFLLWVYGRIPFAENGLLLMASLVYLVYAFWFDRTWGKLLIGLLVAVAGLFGKSFGFVLLLGPVVAVLVDKNDYRWRKFWMLVLPALFLTVVVQLTLFAEQNFLSFLWEHGAGEHGEPHGFSSIPAFFESLISLGRKGMQSYSPTVCLIAAFALIVNLIRPKGKTGFGRTELFMVAWLAGAIVSIAPFNYQPLRYLYWLVIPMAVLAGGLLDRLRGLEIGGAGRISWWRAVALLLILWYLIHYLVVHPFFADLKFPEYYKTVWYSAPGALVLCITLMLTFGKKTVRFSRPVSVAVITLAVTAALLANGKRYIDWYTAKSHNIDEAAADLSTIVSKDAVIGGQYGPALAVGSSLRSFPYFLATEVEATAQTFTKYPVTHIAVSSALWEGYCSAAPPLKRAPVVAKYWLRDTPVLVVRVAEQFRNAVAQRCPLTDLERAAIFRSLQRADSAEVYVERFLKENPQSKSGLMLAFNLAFSIDPMGRARELADIIAANFPGDFVAQYTAASYYHWLAQAKKSAQIEETARTYLAKAIRLSPRNEENLTKMFQVNPPEAPVIR
jgi:hypothetical protein